MEPRARCWAMCESHLVRRLGGKQGGKVVAGGVDIVGVDVVDVVYGRD